MNVPRDIGRSIVAFRLTRKRRHSTVPELKESRLNTRPASSPVNASTMISRSPPHDSGPTWLATPSLHETFIHCTSPALPAHDVPFSASKRASVCHRCVVVAVNRGNCNCRGGRVVGERHRLIQLHSAFVFASPISALSMQRRFILRVTYIRLWFSIPHFRDGVVVAP